MKIQPFFHRESGSLSYLISHQNKAVIIDPVLDYKDGQISTKHVDTILSQVHTQGLKINYVLDTHIHADHLSAAQYVKDQTGAKTVISHRIREVYDQWQQPLALEALSEFDLFVDSTSQLPLGDKTISVIETPGHTPACLTYHIDGHIFVGDTLFKPEKGTARADFPGGSAETLYHSIQSLYSLDDKTQLHLGHDYPPADEPAMVDIPLSVQKELNAMIRPTTSLQEYVDIRLSRDKTLNNPKLLDVAVAFNLTFALPVQQG